MDGKEQARRLYGLPEKPEKERTPEKEERGAAGFSGRGAQRQEAQRNATKDSAPTMPEHLRRRQCRRRRKSEPGRGRDSARPGLAAYVAAHQLGYSRAKEARDLIAGLLHGIQEARHGAGGSGRE